MTTEAETLRGCFAVCTDRAMRKNIFSNHTQFHPRLAKIPFMHIANEQHITYIASFNTNPNPAATAIRIGSETFFTFNSAITVAMAISTEGISMVTE